MATEQTAAAPAKKARKAQGPRVAKPIFALVSYTDESGNAVKLNPDSLTIEFTKDTAELVAILTAGDAGNKSVKQVTLPQPATRKPAAE